MRRCACAHGESGHERGWPRRSSPCLMLIRDPADPTGQRRVRCPCPDFRPIGARQAARRVTRGRGWRLLRWLWGC